MWALSGILTIAFAVRVAYLLTGVPYAVGIDEPAIVNRALRIMQIGDWNPHTFDYPTLVIYLEAGLLAGVRWLSRTTGTWASITDLPLRTIFGTSRVAVAALGTATVWLTYQLGKALESPAVGTIAAAQLAVYPMHVRESHFILTDVPTTALTTAALVLALRAARRHTVAAYAWAGCAAGLAAAAKYNGAVVALTIGIVWMVYERTAEDRWRKLGAALLSSLAAFVLVVPYAILDWPTFWAGLAGQIWRTDPRVVDPAWHTYLQYLSLTWSLWLPLAAIGGGIVLLRRRSLGAWLALGTFLTAYFAVLSTHHVVFGRYTLPLLPGLCVCAAVPAVETARLLTRFTGHRWHGLTMLIMSTIMTLPLASATLGWLTDFRQPDTRTLAAEWMIRQLPTGARLAVPASGPTYLDVAGFTLVAARNQIPDRPSDGYDTKAAEYVLIAPWSERALRGFDQNFDQAAVVFGIDPSEHRWGPFIRVIRMGSSSRLLQGSTLSVAARP
jgi:4-amino-4-deoxy-L-arabinose transferase-like glycosyltransferase